MRRRTSEEKATLLQGLKTWHGSEVHRMPMIEGFEGTHQSSWKRWDVFWMVKDVVNNMVIVTITMVINQ